MKIDLLVVGAGPVGLAMAAELARYGLTVRIVDKAAQRTDKSKALVLWSRTLELLERAGCAQKFVDAGLKATRVNIEAGGKEIAHFTLDGVATAYPYALMLPQSETERLLEEHLNSYGVQTERSVELTQLSQTADGVTATLRKADGSLETIESAWLAGCDGAHSVVRHQLGLQFEGNTLHSDWILADVHLAGLKRTGEIEIFWHQDGILAIFPIATGRFRIIANVDKSATNMRNPSMPDSTASLNDPADGPTIEEVRAILDRRGPGGVTASHPVWLAGFHINERKVSDYRSSRIFLAGDAAHIHSPAGGQGMNTGIQDACNLAWKLALVQHGLCSPEPLLASYNTERSAVGAAVLKAAGRMTEIGLLKGTLPQKIRNHVAALLLGLPPVLKAMTNAATEISIRYPKGPLTPHDSHAPGGPAPGERAPIRNDEPPIGAGSRPRFVLFATPDSNAHALIARHASLLEEHSRPPFHEDGIWLVRPDGYVAVAARKDQWNHLEAFLESIGAR
jgi:2-polyprenyl-6-methoxyphenol hydroxylase-like FAD-dependent oxidoreductase